MIIGDFNQWHWIENAAAYRNQLEPDGTGHLVAILRATDGTTIEDEKYGFMVSLFRAVGEVLGHYGYMNDSEDAFQQGVFFGQTVKKYGGLQPGEPIYCDCEEGSGNQEPRVVAFLQGAHSVLNDPTVDEGEYSGASFYSVHIGVTTLPDGTVVHRWIAAYGQSTPPSAAEDWQFADNHPFAGCPQGTADATIFNGTVDQFKALFGFGQAPPAPRPIAGPPVIPPITIPPFTRDLVFQPGRVITHGPDVLEWQQRMAQRGWPIGAKGKKYGAADAFYGQLCAELCKAFEVDQHLNQENGPYGIVGPQVWHATWANPVTH